jgi:hypothetical protein
MRDKRIAENEFQMGKTNLSTTYLALKISATCLEGTVSKWTV